MKIKTYKYIVIYFIIIVFSFLVYRNINTVTYYIKNIRSILLLNKLENKEKISVLSYSNDSKKESNSFYYEKFLNNLFSNKKNKSEKKVNFDEEYFFAKLLLNSWFTWLNNIDLSNLNFILWNFDESEKLIKNKWEYDYKDLYNLWNISFLKWYYLFIQNKTWYVENLQKAVSYYKDSLSMVPSYKKKYFILQNFKLAQKYLNYLYFYNCNSFFIKLLNLNNDILKVIVKVNTTLKSLLSALQKWEKYDSVKNCILKFENDTKQNLVNMYSNYVFFNNIKKGIIILYKNNIDDVELCNVNMIYMKTKYWKSLNSSLLYFTKFEDKQKKLLYIFNMWQLKDIEKLCDGRWKLAKHQDNENKKMMKNYEKLKDLLNQKRQNKWKNRENNKKNWKKWDSKIKNEFKELNKKVFDEIKEKSKDMLKKVQKRKTKTGYDPIKDYIKPIFKEFYGDKSVFDVKKQESIWK